MQVIGVFNRDGGTFKTTDMDAFAARAAAIFGEVGQRLDVRVVSGSDLIPELKRAATEADVLLAGGGDGTISAAAGVAYRHGIPLAVLPAGTMNLFARSIGVPLDLDAALRALASGDTKAVDIATANGRPFIHQYSVGIHPKLVRLRDQLSYRSRIGKMIASCRAAISAVTHPPNFHIEVMTKQGLERRRVAGLSVSNNPLGEGHLPHPDALDQGMLGLYLIKPLTPRALLRLAFGLARGKFKSLPEIIDKEVREATVRFPRRKWNALAVIDGELIDLEPKVVLKIIPRGLQVVVPKTATKAAPEARELVAS